MGGSFIFALKDAKCFNKDRYLATIENMKNNMKPPKEVYVSFGPHDMDVAMLIKVGGRSDWTLVLPMNPVESEIQCGLTYGIVSRTHVWHYVRDVLCELCRELPGAFKLEYEDADMGPEVVEAGRWDEAQGGFVVEHRGVPSQQEAEFMAATAEIQQRHATHLAH